jgi:hypothetical protein
MDAELVLRKIEPRLRHTRLALAGTILVLIALAAGRLSHVGASTGNAKVLHARGLVIEDANGRPRLLLGAQTPDIPGRRRPEGVGGIVLLGENGADRVVIAYPGIEPQVMGRVEKRRFAIPSAGLVINDSDGNERAGFGVSDDGKRISLGLDYADRDAMGLLVSPGFSGVAVFARDGERNDQLAMGVAKDGTSLFKLADRLGNENLIIEVGKSSVLRLLIGDPVTHNLQDIATKLLR